MGKYDAGYMSPDAQKDEQKEIEKLKNPHELDEQLSAIDDDEEAKFKDRYGNLRGLQQRTAERAKEAEAENEKLAERIAALEEKLSKGGDSNDAPPATAEEVAAWIEKYPDSARMIKAVVATEQTAKIDALESKIEELQATGKQQKQKDAYERLVELQPDAPKLFKDEDFQTWLYGLPRTDWAYKALTKSNPDPEEAAQAIDKYLTTGKKKAKKTKDVPSSMENVDSGNSSQVVINDDDVKTRTWKASEVAVMSIQQYEKYQLHIKAAQREGRFVNDA